MRNVYHEACGHVELFDVCDMIYNHLAPMKGDSESIYVGS